MSILDAWIEYNTDGNMHLELVSEAVWNLDYNTDDSTS